MPLYPYECVECKQYVEVLRSMSEHDRLPGKDDLPTSEVTDCDHKWERIIGPVTKQYGSSWGWDRKGSYNSGN